MAFASDKTDPGGGLFDVIGNSEEFPITQKADSFNLCESMLTVLTGIQGCF